jgi:hypothetical protein
METYSVVILNPKAVRLLEDLADLELITLESKTSVLRQVQMSDEAWNNAYRRIMQGGSQQLDVAAMIAEIKEDRPMPFRDNE